jgi:nitrogen regulatory protein PII
MKAVFISLYQAFYDEVMEILDKNEIRGFTFWNEVQGRGSHDGEPHYGTHAWPTLNSAVLAFVPDEKVKPLLHDIHELDVSAPQQGLRAFVLNAEEVTDKDL